MESFLLRRMAITLNVHRQEELGPVGGKYYRAEATFKGLAGRRERSERPGESVFFQQLMDLVFGAAGDPAESHAWELRLRRRKNPNRLIEESPTAMAST
jgi:hypothetical protein